MKQTSINDIIKGYTESVDVTKDNIDDLTVEIAMMAKQSSDFIKESSITRDDIYKNLSKHIVSTSDSVEELDNSIKETSSNVKDSNKEIVKNTSNFSQIMGNAVDLTKSKFSDLDTVDTVQQHTNDMFRGVMGDTMRHFDMGMSLFSSMKNDFKKIFGIKKKKTGVEKEVSGIRKILLKGLLLNKQEHLEDLRERKDKDKKSMLFIEIIAMLIGGLLRKLILPFEIIIETLKTFAKGLNLKLLFKGTNKLSKSILKISESFKMLYNNMKSILKMRFANIFKKGGIIFKLSKFFSMIKDKSKVITSIVKTFAFKSRVFTLIFKSIKAGFKFLGWPLQIIFSLIDFIKGFAKSNEKSFFGKFKDGVVEMITSFFEMPIRLLAWMIEKVSFGKIRGLGDDWISLFRENVLGIFAPLTYVLSIIKNVGSTLNKLGKFGKMLKFIGKLFPKFIGKLFYPITILLSVFDFVKGFAESEDKSIFGRLKSGIVSVFMGLVELPLKILGFVIDKIISFVTGSDFTGSGNSLIKIVKGTFSFIVDSILKPFRMIWEYLKMVGNIFTGDFEGAIENIKNIGREMFSPILDFFENISQFIWNLIPDKIQDNIKEIFSPITGFFVKIGKFVGKILSFVASKLKKIPVIGKFFKSDNEKNTEKINDLVKQKQKLKQDIAKQEQEIKSGDNRTWAGRKRTTIIKNKKEDVAKINKQIEEEKAKQGTVVYEKVKGELKVKHDYRTEFQKQRALSRKEESKKTKEKIRSRTTDATGATGVAGITGVKSKAYSRIKKEEGYRKNLYRDSRGYWTGGHGTLISKDKSITKKQANTLANKKFGFSESMSNKEKSSLWNKQYNKDFIKAKQSMEKYALKQGVPLNDKQKDVLTDMSYNMGIKKLSGFHDMWGALKKGDTNKAANEMMDSKWYGQVGDRSKNLVAEMRSSKPSQLEGINGAVIAKANMKKREVESRKGLGKTISKNMKNMNKTVASNQQTQPVVINNNNQNHEPPEDIESMSILWLNKSYGLG